MTECGKCLQANPTAIPGLTLWDLPVHGGGKRGWFKENEKMAAAGLSDLGPVQNTISFNDAADTTRGIQAGPWDGTVVKFDDPRFTKN
jgi:dTDP-4-dehydrorhamnose 3,5-epimerase-like enzyme